MSFSSELKDELGGVYDRARHCHVARLAALVLMNARVSDDGGVKWLSLSSENPVVAGDFVMLAKKLFGISIDFKEVRSARHLNSYSIKINDKEYPAVFEALKLCGESSELLPDVKRLTSKLCCRRAFLREVFIAAGSVSNPDKFYHFEILCRNRSVSEIVSEAMHSLSLAAKQTARGEGSVVYLKEIGQISDALALMGARMSLLELENLRIVRETRGNVNRRVNCETANINKTAAASAKQTEDILFIKSRMNLNSLPDGLDEMAKIRLEYPEATLSELGKLLDPPIGKSGVNHRLRKLSSIARSLE